MAELDPVFSDLTPSDGSNFNVGAWYQSQNVPGVPDTIAPYLAAHGFLVTGGVPYFLDGEFGGWLVNMNRTAFSHADSVQNLLNAMVFAYNEGRTINDTRYEDIIAGMQQTLSCQQDDATVVEAEFAATHALIVVDIDTITADAPTLAEWTSSLEALDAKVAEYDTEVAALRATYVLNAAAITDAIAAAFTEADAALTAYRGEVLALKTEQDAIETSIVSILATETSDLAGHDTVMSAALDVLDDQYAVHLASANAALASMETAITNFATASDTIIAAMEAEQAAHETVIAGLLAEITASFDATEGTLTTLLSTILSDYGSHETTATAFLTDLGVTELARINERFDASISAQLQQLTNRGFYSSAMSTDVTTRNTRERNEAIGELNDRLNREKFENQHRLYGQQQGMRGTHISVHQGLATLEQQTIQFRTDANSQLNTRSQEIRRVSLQSRQEVERTRTELYRMQIGVAESFNRSFVEIKATTVSGLSQLQTARLAVTRGQSGTYHTIFTQLSDAFGKSLTGEQQFAGIDATLRQSQQQYLARIEDLGQSWARVSAGLLETGIATRSSVTKLGADVRQAYYDIILRQEVQQAQLRLSSGTAKAELIDSHTNETTRVAAALFGFAERREDSYPGIGDMAAVVSSLGDDQ